MPAPPPAAHAAWETRPHPAPAPGGGRAARRAPPTRRRAWLSAKAALALQSPGPGSEHPPFSVLPSGPSSRSPAVMSPEAVPSPPPCRGCDCGEPLAQRVEKGDEAFRAGEYETAAGLFRSALAGPARSDRGLCLRLGDALARAGRLPEALGAFRGAARLGALRPDELGELASGLACVPGPRERRSPVEKPGRAPGEAPSGGPSASVPAAPRDLLDCPRCQRLLHKPVTLPCGLTVCRRCAEPGPGRPPVRRVNVVLSGLLEKCFPAECRARKLAGQVQSLQRQQQPEAALLKCHQALDLGKRGLGHLHARLLRGRAGTGKLGSAGGALALSGGGERRVGASCTCGLSFPGPPWPS